MIYPEKEPIYWDEEYWIEMTEEELEEFWNDRFSEGLGGD